MKSRSKHGTYANYTNGKCRCKRCRRARKDYVNRPGKNLTHGIRASYNNGCRCDECTTANREYDRERAVAVKRAAG